MSTVAVAVAVVRLCGLAKLLIVRLLGLSALCVVYYLPHCVWVTTNPNPHQPKTLYNARRCPVPASHTLAGLYPWTQPVIRLYLDLGCLVGIVHYGLI